MKNLTTLLLLFITYSITAQNCDQIKNKKQREECVRKEQLMQAYNKQQEERKQWEQKRVAERESNRPKAEKQVVSASSEPVLATEPSNRPQSHSETNRWMTVIIGQDSDHVLANIQSYLSEEMGMEPVSESASYDGDVFSLEFRKEISWNNEVDSRVKLEASVEDKKIVSFELQGNYHYLLDFFIGYYETTVDVTENNPCRNLGSDKACLTFLSGDVMKLEVGSNN